MVELHVEARDGVGYLPVEQHSNQVTHLNPFIERIEFINIMVGLDRVLKSSAISISHRSSNSRMCPPRSSNMVW